jgi:hypothetical protein
VPLSRLDRRGIVILCGVGVLAVALLASVVGVMWLAQSSGPTTVFTVTDGY